MLISVATGRKQFEQQVYLISFIHHRVSVNYMGLLNRVEQWLSAHNGTQNTVFFEERAGTPDIDIVPSSQVSATRLGITDSEAPDEEQQDLAYRGLVQMMVSMRADAIASAMMKVMVKRQVGDEEFEDVEEGHPWKVILRNPTPNSSTREFWEITSKLRDMGAGAFHYIDRDSRNVPECFLPIYPAFGEVLPMGDVTGGIGGFVYYSGSSIIPIERADMLWVRHTHPVTPYKSGSLLQAAAFQADKDVYFQIYSRDSVRDGNLPPFYVTFKDTLNREQKRDYREQFGKNYREVGKAGNTPILGGEGKIETLGIKPDDLQYIESSKLNSKELMMIFGFPPGMFEETGVVANSKELNRGWYTRSIQPEVDQLCSDLTFQFRLAYNATDSDLIIMPPDVIPRDKMEEARIAQIRIQSATLKPSEVRAMNGEEEDAILDQFFISGGLRPVEDMMAPAVPAPQPAPEPEEELAE